MGGGRVDGLDNGSDKKAPAVQDLRALACVSVVP